MKVSESNLLLLEEDTELGRRKFLLPRLLGESPWLNLKVSYEQFAAFETRLESADLDLDLRWLLLLLFLLLDLSSL